MPILIATLLTDEPCRIDNVPVALRDIRTTTRLLEALDSRGIKATLSINGSVCDVYPRLAGAAHEAGWEFMGHAQVQRPTHLVEDQRERCAPASTPSRA